MAQAVICRNFTEDARVVSHALPFVVMMDKKPLESTLSSYFGITLPISLH
jgi:hypothetical protein